MISTATLANLPERHRLRNLWKSLSALDSIFAKDWLDRYFTYNSQWGADEEFGSMRNGEGDEVLVLFRKDGCVINGMAHEFFPKKKNEITRGLLRIYEEFIFGEPVHSIGTTFCLWTDENSEWRIGNIEDYQDGSTELLKLLDGNPETYVTWASEYYDKNVSLEAVSRIYKQELLTPGTIYELDKGFDHLGQLKIDLKEIDYPVQV